METIFTDYNAWYDHYETIKNIDEQISFFHETFDKIEDVVASEFDETIIDNIFDILGHLEKEKKFDEIDAFVLTIREKQAPFYKENFHYFINDSLYYYLHVGNDEKAKFFINEFIAYADIFIDSYLNFSGLIGLYGKDDWTIELVEDYFAKVHDNNEVDESEVKNELMLLIQPVITQKYYLLAKETGSFDYEQWSKDLKPYGFEFNSAPTKNVVLSVFEAKHYNDVVLLDSKSVYFYLQIHLLFAKYMKDEFDMPFSSSYPIAKIYVEYWLQYNKNQSLILNSEHLKEHLNNQFDFFEYYFYKIYTGTFGILYLYDFLLEMNIIDDTLHSSAIAISNELKKELFKGNETIWKYNGFLKTWKKPASYSQEEFQEVLDHVNSSFEDVIEHEEGEDFFSFETIKSKNFKPIARFFDNPNSFGDSGGSNIQRKKPVRKKKPKPKPKQKKKKK